MTGYRQSALDRSYHFFFLSFLFFFSFSFLVADTRLYTLPCRSVRPSVRWSIGPSVTFLNCEQFSHYCSFPTVRDWIAVYPALFSFIAYFLLKIFKQVLHCHIFCSKCPKRYFENQLQLAKKSILRQSSVEIGLSN